MILNGFALRASPMRDERAEWPALLGRVLMDP
jgi:hypothetical protein